MGIKARESLAWKWFQKGFLCSGRGFNGDTYDQALYPSMDGLLLAEFDRQFSSPEAETLFQGLGLEEGDRGGR